MSLRILQVSARYIPFVGGTEIHTAQVSKNLVGRGHQVTVASTQVGDSLPPEDKIDGVSVVRVPAWPWPPDFYVAPGLADVVDGDWDLVHVQGYHTAVAPIALRAAFARGIPTALTFHSGGHSSSFRNRLRPLQIRALRPLLRNVDLLIGVSGFEARLFTRWLGQLDHPIRIVPNGVSTLEDAPSTGPSAQREEDRAVARDRSGAPSPSVDGKPAAGRPGDRRTIISIGRLVRYKGHHRIIRALPHVLATHPEVHLLILGTGPYEDRLRSLVSKLGLDGHVTFDHIPSHERHRLVQLLKDASMAVLLSDYESHGMAAHEALSVGLRLIVLDRTALSDLAAAGLAGAVPPGANDREIAQIVARNLDRTDDARPDRAALEAVGGSQTWSDITGRLESLYLDTVRDGGR